MTTYIVPNKVGSQATKFDCRGDNQDSWCVSSPKIAQYVFFLGVFDFFLDLSNCLSMESSKCWQSK